MKNWKMSSKIYKFNFKINFQTISLQNMSKLILIFLMKKKTREKISSIKTRQVFPIIIKIPLVKTRMKISSIQPKLKKLLVVMKKKNL